MHTALLKRYAMHEEQKGRERERERERERKNRYSQFLLSCILCFNAAKNSRVEIPPSPFITSWEF